MQETSALYKSILESETYYTETRMKLAGNDGYFTEDDLISVKTTRKVFKENHPDVGCCICGEADVELYANRLIDGLRYPFEFPRQAKVELFIRLVSTADSSASEWIRKGVFFVDTRKTTKDNDDLDVLTIHCYDAMIKAETLYGDSTLQFPCLDITLVRDIARQIGTVLDERCAVYFTDNYLVPYPAQYTMRESLGFIAKLYAGNFVINDMGELQFIPIWALPPETSLLIDNIGNKIVFGQSPNEKVRILL